MGTGTYTQSYTVVDVGKVLDCFAADFDMAAQSTGLRTREDVRATSADVKRMATFGYLKAVTLCLLNGAGIVIRAAKYEVTNGATLAASRPGNSLWPRMAAGLLHVHVEYNQVWSSLSQQQRLEFRQGLVQGWGASALDTSFPGLNRSTDRNYVSNGYALQRTSFQ
jgi:hypothetical protein